MKGIVGKDISVASDAMRSDAALDKLDRAAREGKRVDKGVKAAFMHAANWRMGNAWTKA